MSNSCLVLNPAMQPLGAISFEEAICLIVQEKAWVHVEHPTKVYRSKYLSINAPLVVILNHFVKAEGFQFKPEQPYNSNLFRRDNYTCQYCGRHRKDLESWEKLTRDHVIPLARDGTNVWENLVTACSTCNFKKGDKLLYQSGMKLLKQPKIPMTWVIRGKAKLSPEQIRLVEQVIGLVKEIIDDTETTSDSESS